MRVKSRNLVEIIFQAMILTMLFLPGMYLNAVQWPNTETSRYGYVYTTWVEKHWGVVSLVTKIGHSAWPIGILILLAAVAGTVFFILQFTGKGQRRNWGLTLIPPVAEFVLLMAYTFIWSHSDGYRSALRYEDTYFHVFKPDVLFYLTSAALVALIVITWIGYFKAKKDGILDAAPARQPAGLPYMQPNGQPYPPQYTQPIVQPTAPQAASQAASTQQTTASASSVVVDELMKAKQLLDSGAITQEEYETIKMKVLSR